MDTIAPSPGDRLGPYLIEAKVGSGGMASVYRATHAELGNSVALKLMAPAIAKRLNGSLRFLREARTVAQLKHPHIVDAYDVGTWQGLPYLAMEFLVGGDLAAHLRAKGALSVRETIDVMLPIVSAVSAAHAHGVIHRDLKPSNVLMARRGSSVTPKVVDFGIAKRESDEGEALTHPDALVGTVHYMAPEQLRSAQAASRASDQYALGVMLYQCLTGALPFDAPVTCDAMVAILTADVLRPQVRNAAVPADLDAIVLRAMRRDPKQRFPSVHALGAALLPFGGPAAIAIWSAEFGQDATPEAPGKGGTLEESGVEPLVRTQRLPSLDGDLSTVPRRVRRILLGLAGAAAGAFALVAFLRMEARAPSGAPRDVAWPSKQEGLTYDSVHEEPIATAAAAPIASAPPRAPRRAAPTPIAAVPPTPQPAPRPRAPLPSPNGAPILE